MTRQSWLKRVFFFFRYGLIERIKFSDKGRRIALVNTRVKARPGLTTFEQRLWFWPVVSVVSFSLFSTGIMLLAPDLGKRSVFAGLSAGTLAAAVCILLRAYRRQRFLTPNILPRFTRHDARDRVPMIRRHDHDRVNISIGTRRCRGRSRPLVRCARSPCLVGFTIGTSARPEVAGAPVCVELMGEL